MKNYQPVTSDIATLIPSKDIVQSVVIASKNGLHHLTQCLPSVIRAVQKAPFETEIIVVDDNSSDDTCKNLPLLFPQIKVLKNDKAGVCSARNLGAKHSKGNWLLFIDNDVFLNEDFFITAHKYLQPNTFCVACCGYWANDPTKQLDGVKLLVWKRGCMRFTENILNHRLNPNKLYPSFGVQGAYFFCQQKFFNLLNGFDEELFDPYMLEETDLMYRGLKRGWQIVYAQDTRPLHKCGGTIQSKTNKLTLFLSKRNSLIFTWKNISSHRLLAFNLLWCVLRPNFNVFREVFKVWAIIKKKRAVEKNDQVISDKELLSQSAHLMGAISHDK